MYTLFLVSILSMKLSPLSQAVSCLSFCHMIYPTSHQLYLTKHQNYKVPLFLFLVDFRLGYNFQQNFYSNLRILEKESYITKVQNNRQFYFLYQLILAML